MDILIKYIFHVMAFLNVVCFHGEGMGPCHLKYIMKYIKNMNCCKQRNKAFLKLALGRIHKND